MIIPKPKSSDAFVVGGKDTISLNILNPSKENNSFSINTSVSPSAKISLPILQIKLIQMLGEKGYFVLINIL